MNFVGKIFVVLIFVMSLVFMAFAVAVYATHQNWKNEITSATGWKFRLNQATDEYKTLKDKADVLKERVSAAELIKAEALAKASTHNAQLDGQVKKLEDDVKAAEKAHSDAVAAVDAAQANIKKITDEVAAARKAVTEAQEKEAVQFKKASDLTNEINQLKGEIGPLKARAKELAAENTRLSDILNVHGIPLNFDPRSKPFPAPATVVNVNAEGYLEISIGTDDGVRKGQKFDVFRGSDFLGRVTVMRVESDKAVAKFDETIKHSVVQKGDLVKASR